MKRVGGLLILVAVVSLILPARQASAAACANVSSFGAVYLTVPELTKIDNQLVWLRVQAPEPSSRILVEVNGEECIEVSFTSPANQWSWQTRQNAGLPVPLSFPHSKGNTIKLIGVADGVKVDRVLLTEADCTPRDFGNNCQTTVELRTDESQVATLEPPTDGTVNGRVVLSQTPDKNKDQIKTVDYIAEGTVIQTSTRAEPFDTTLLPNGKHRIQINTTLADGTVIREATVIDIRNPESFYAPISRWIRNNSAALRIVGTIAILLASFLILRHLLRKLHKKKRQRKFHGF